MKRAALTYAKRGWPVLPLHTPVGAACSCGRAKCSSPGKHPRTMHGSKAATTDTEKIAKWWGMWPDANIGIATGVAIRADVPGLQVLDVESYASDELERLIAGREWPRVPTVYTGGGGLHFYFAGDGPNSVKQLGHGIDTRGAGGFVAAPPSLHVSGERYDWLMYEALLQAWPDWLTPPVKDGLFQETEYVGHGTRYAKAALKRETDAVRTASEGCRNDQLNRSTFAVGRFVRSGELGMREIVDAFIAAAVTAGLDEDEARQTIASGLKART